MYERNLDHGSGQPNRFGHPEAGIAPYARIVSCRGLTHLVVPIFALSSCANERIKPWLDTIADNSMQTFVWRLVATEEV